MTIITMHKVNENHLARVTSEMKTLGTPTVRAIWDGEVYYAVEGTHRLMAAYNLGLEPIIEHVEYSDETIIIELDGSEEEFVVSELADMLMATNGSNSHILRF